MSSFWLIILSTAQCFNATAQAGDNDFVAARKLYTNGLYDSAINFSVYTILKKESEPEPRLYRLIGYCYKELGQPEAGIKFFSAYLVSKRDSSSLLPVFASMGELYSRIPRMEDSAIAYYAKSIQLENDETEKRIYFRNIINLYRRKRDYKNILLWTGSFCKSQLRPSNIDFVNWGLAAYRVKNYKLADSIFTVYRRQHPAEEYGYYWLARSRAAIDSAMQSGLAVPVYKSLIAVVAKDSTVNISFGHQLEALGYVVCYYLKLKNTREAQEYLEKILLLDPNNPDARKYMHSIKENGKRK